MNKKTVTVGIPAFNEEKNIGTLLESIFLQRNDNFNLNEIKIICDGSTDATYDIAKNYEKRSPLIKVTRGGERLGKSARLNEFYRDLKSDILIIFDADVILGEENVLVELVGQFKDRRVGLVGGRDIPLEQKSIVSEALRTYEYFWKLVTDKINDGNNVHNHPGLVSAGRKTFLKQVTIPNYIVAEDHFLYFEALRLGFKFKSAKNAIVYFKSPSTIKDFFLQTTRFQNGGEAIKKYFGSWALSHYHVPAKIKLHAYIRTFFKMPVYLVVALVLQILQRFYNQKPSEINSVTWKIVTTSK